MPAVNPRITITLQPSVHALLRRLSEVTGNSQSSIVADLLSDASSVLERMVRILEAAQKLKQQGKAVGEEFKDSLNAVQASMEAQLGLLLETLEEGGGALLRGAEQVVRRRAPAGTDAPAARPARAGRSLTPMSNRGVTPHREGRQEGRKSGSQGGSGSRGRGGNSRRWA